MYLSYIIHFTINFTIIGIYYYYTAVCEVEFSNILFLKLRVDSKFNIV